MNSISINKPADLKTKRFYNELSGMINNDIKDIQLECQFITDDFTSILNEFRILKNNIAFDRDIKRNKFKS